MASSDVQQTLIIVKPDGFQRGLVGEIISRFEAADFSVVGLRCIQLTDELAGEFYQEHAGKDFYDGLVEFMTSSPVALLALERNDAIARARQIVGKTNPLEATPGTIRADLGLDGGRNTVHASD
ncbi:MAG TPA: nucleoside-diphosphate kinase, partial [Armatimonadota bacterium]|nr:nucleoside-diphosphate kinase [Armatimonadota bacterium]